MFFKIRFLSLFIRILAISSPSRELGNIREENRILFHRLLTTSWKFDVYRSLRRGFYHTISGQFLMNRHQLIGSNQIGRGVSARAVRLRCQS